MADLPISIQDLDAKGGQLKETGEKLALTSARYLVKVGCKKTTENYIPLSLSLSVCSHLRFAMFSLEQTKVDLMESMGESRKRKEEIEVTLAPLQDFTPLQICPL